MNVVKKTDRIILRRLFIASIIFSLSVFTVPLELLESSGKNINHSPYLLSQLSTSGPDGFAETTDRSRLKDESKYHIVFSTGCSVFQDWQSYVFFYHVLQSGQEGQVTRIASGCDESQKHDLNRVFETEIASMAPGRFHLHHTPDYSKIKADVSYVYFNKPFGMKHWMENVLGYPQEKHHDDEIIILMDPDQIIKRPLSAEFQLTSEDWHIEPSNLRVDHGSPFAQMYGFGVRWKTKIRFSSIFPNSSTPINKLKMDEIKDYYHAMGPPYLATAKDMYRIVNVWSDVVPRVHDQFPKLLAEMFAYNIAAAHLGLRHTLAKSFMLSSPMTYKIEAWEKLVDPLPANHVCSKDLPQESYPHVIHYCQRYGVGKWFFDKYKFKRNKFLSCGAPLLKEPPQNLEDLHQSAVYPGGPNNVIINLPMPRRRQDTFMLCNVIRDVNRALVHYKQHHCESANYGYTLTFFANMTWEG